ncbi:MAG: ribose 5-phosphate isomerase B [Anaerolineales bacterium]
MSAEDQVRRIVRRVVYRTLGRSPRSPARPLIAEREVQAVSPGGTLNLPEGALVTPLARQLAFERRVSIQAADRRLDSKRSRAVALGADHGGYKLKETLLRSLAEWGYEVFDCGTQNDKPVDYPDYALAVAQLVANGRAWRGVVVDGAGIGSCMAANKVPGVRAAMCYDQATALSSREHNDANLLTLGAGLIGENLAKSILSTFLATAFAGGRHTARVAKISNIERRFLRQGAPAP